MRNVIMVAAIVISACSLEENPQKIIMSAESRIDLPKGAGNINEYDRYYAVTDGWADGIWIRSGNKNGKIIIVPRKNDLPYKADGSCGVIRVRLEITKGVWEKPFCHAL
jgi:hypothetical protein